MVRGAELRCTGAEVSDETTIFMLNSTSTNNAEINGIPVGNRGNTKKFEDIMPFTKCKLRKGIPGLSENEDCAEVMKTADFWENLSLPRDEIKVPYFRFGKVHNLGDVVGREEYEDTYRRIIEEYRKIGGRRVSYKTLRYMAHLKMEAEPNAANDACVTLNSILLCKSCGGIIYPVTDGQMSGSISLFISTLRLPFDKIDDAQYKALARFYLVNLLNSLEGTETFIGYCFDHDNRIWQDYFAVYGTSADVWKANEKKFEKLLFFMREHLAEDERIRREHGTDPPENLDLRHRYLLFDMASKLEKPTSGIGEGRPDISITYNESTPFFEAQYLGEKVIKRIAESLKNIPELVEISVPPSFILNYKQFEHEQGIGGATDGYILTGHNAMIFRPSNRLSWDNQLRDLHFTATAIAVDKHPSSPGTVSGFARDHAVSLGLGIASDTGKMAGVVGYTVMSALAANSMMDAVRYERNVEGWKDAVVIEEYYNLLSDKMFLNKGTAIFSDDAIGVQHRLYLTEEALKLLEDKGLDQESFFNSYLMP